MKQALEALEMFCEYGIIDKPFERRNALYDAIKQAEKQAAAYKYTYTPYGLRADELGNLSIGELPRKEWVGLHLDDIPESYAGDKSFLNIARWAEAKLKEKNGAL